MLISYKFGSKAGCPFNSKDKYGNIALVGSLTCIKCKYNKGIKNNKVDCKYDRILKWRLLKKTLDKN